SMIDRDEPFYENEKDPKRGGPTAFLKIFAYDASSSVRAGGPTYAISEAQQPMLEWQSRVGKLAPPEKVFLPPWFKGIPELKDDPSKQARKKAVKVCYDLAKGVDTKLISVAL